MAERQPGKTDAGGRTWQSDGKRGTARVLAVFAHCNLGRERGEVGEQAAHVLRGGAGVERGDEFDRLLQFFEVGGQLGF